MKLSKKIGYEVVDMDLPQHVHDGIIKLAKNMA